MWFFECFLSFILFGFVSGFWPPDLNFLEENPSDHNPFQLSRPFKHFSQQKEVNETIQILKERLPRVANISSYDLSIKINFPFDGLENSNDAKNNEKDFTYEGNVTIHFNMINGTVSKFPLFVKSSVNITGKALLKDGKEIEIERICGDKDIDLINVELKKKLELGRNYSLTLNFNGKIEENTGQLGLFYNKYIDENNKTQYLIATQFEDIHARQMFPSADDPHFKSTVKLTLIHPSGSQVYSNSEIEEQTEDNFNTNEYTTTKFKPTPVMSIYLLAFTIEKFREVKTTSKSGVPIRVISYTKEGLKESADLAAKCLNAMEKLVKVPYNHTKLDHVSIKNVGAGAMENWGHITYTSNMLSFVPNQTKLEEQYILYNIICHETAHQWFGNLVTGDDWGQVFLHESFANFFETHTLLEDEDEEIVNKDFVREQIKDARDWGLQSFDYSKHAIVSNISHFDAITYGAGGAVVNMVKTVIGNDNFYKAVTNYLNKNAYKTATYKDLVKVFEVAHPTPLCGNDLKIGEFLKDFLLQPAYPVIDISLEKNQFIFKQFASNGDKNLKWNIPLFVREIGKNGQLQLIWLLKNNTLCYPKGPIKLDSKKNYNFNANSYSFFEEKLSADLWEKRLASPVLSKLDISEQADLIILAAMADERNNKTGTATNYFEKLANKILDGENQKISTLLFFKYFHGTKLDPKKAYKHLDWDSSDYFGKIINGQHLARATKANYNGFQEKGVKEFKKFQENCSGSNDKITCNTIVPENREAAYCAILIKGDDNLLEFFNLYAKIVESKQDLNYSIGKEWIAIKNAREKCKQNS